LGAGSGALKRKGKGPSLIWRQKTANCSCSGVLRQRRSGHAACNAVRKWFSRDHRNHL